MTQLEELCNLNIKSLRGMLKILKPIKADEAAAVRLMLAQILQNSLDMRKVITVSKKKPMQNVDWADITGDIE